MGNLDARQPGLDGLRAIAVLAVLAAHCDLLQGGGHGVDLFFVLSGFLITRLLSKNPSLWRFWWRRLQRLYPALLCLLVAYAAIGSVILPFADLKWIEIGLAGTYTMNFFMPYIGQGGLSHTWSLAVEAQFYLLWPLTVVLLNKSKRPLLWLIVAWLVLTGARALLMPDAAVWVYYSPLHSTGLILGAALAFAPTPSRVLGWLAVPAIGAVFLFGGFLTDAWSTPVIEVASALVIASAVQPGLMRQGLAWPPLVGVGLLSYGVYLWHYPIARALQESPWQFPLTLAASLGLATLTFFTVETMAGVRGPASTSPGQPVARAPVGTSSSRRR